MKKKPEDSKATSRFSRGRPVALMATALLVALAVLLSSVGALMAASVVATVSVGSSPIGVGVNPTTNKIYVANRDDNTVSVINGATSLVTGSAIAVGTNPIGVGVNPTTNKIYVANRDDNTVSVINGATDLTGSAIAVGVGPSGVGVNPTTDKIYVANNGDSTVSVIDGATGTTPGPAIAVGTNPTAVGVNPTTNKIYVANWTAGTVSVIDGATGTTPGPAIAVGTNPTAVGVNPSTDKIYVANRGSNTVSVINGATGLVTGSAIVVGSNPTGVGVNPTTNKIYVANRDDNTVSVINGATGLVTGSAIAVGTNPFGVGVNPSTDKIYVANNGADTVSVISEPPAPEYGYYFAEGTTRTNFQEYLCMGNSGDQAASAQVTYLFTDGTTKDASYTVPANSRYTVNVNSEVGPNKDLSLKVLSDSPNLVAERPMYFNYNGWTGGHDAVGATAPNTKWYFAEGNTLPEFDQYVTVLNPGDTPANLTFHYMVEGQGEEDVPRQVGAHSRDTVKTRDQIGDGKHESLYLESDQPVVAERPMYFNYVGLAQNNWTGGHDAVGTNSPAKDWYFAEGTTRKNSVDGAFEQWLCLQNPGTKPLTVAATYQLAAGQGDPISKSYTVPAQQRLTVSVNGEIGPNKDCSVYLRSDSAFIAERPMYFSYHAYAWTGGHDVLGVNSTATTWFFAEGTTRTNFEEWLCLQNPGNSDAHTTITYYTTSGQVINKSWTVQANTRLTVSANSDVGANQDISAKVSSDKPIIVERPMYFNYNGWTGGHDAVGFVPSP